MREHVCCRATLLVIGGDARSHVAFAADQAGGNAWTILSNRAKAAERELGPVPRCGWFAWSRRWRSAST